LICSPPAPYRPVIGTTAPILIDAGAGPAGFAAAGVAAGAAGAGEAAGDAPGEAAGEAAVAGDAAAAGEAAAGAAGDAGAAAGAAGFAGSAGFAVGLGGAAAGPHATRTTATAITIMAKRSLDDAAEDRTMASPSPAVDHPSLAHRPGHVIARIGAEPIASAHRLPQRLEGVK
jgi:hypothetical protein